MKPLRAYCEQTELAIQTSIRAALVQAGFTITEKTHGNKFMAGWPDLYVFHPIRGHRWIEVKTPRGSMTPAQRARFAAWTGAGEGVWILCDTDLSILYKPANWLEWLTEPQRAHYDKRWALIMRNGPRVSNWKEWM